MSSIPNENVPDHFVEVNKMIKSGYDVQDQADDIQLKK